MNEREHAIVCYAIMRSSSLYKKLPINMARGLDDLVRQKFFKNLSDSEIEQVNQEITNFNNAIKSEMMRLFFKAGAKDTSLEGLKGLLGLKKETVEDLKQLKNQTMLSQKDNPFDKETLSRLERLVKEGVQDSEEDRK